MSKWLICICVLFVLLGCSKKNGMIGEQPPETMIEIGNQMYETTLGTYCWTSSNFSRCVDSPVVVKGQNPITIKPSDEITFVMDYQPKPNEFQLLQINDVGQTEIALKGNRFTAPAQKGTYSYSYGVWWMDEKVANLSHGDAFYAFVLEVK
jgi:hypothetical protein